MISNIFDETPDVRAEIARNSRITEADAWALASDPELFIREALAANPSIPIEIFACLAEDSDIYVQRAVAQNMYTPVDILRKLRTLNTDVLVRDYAKRTLRKISTEGPTERGDGQ